MSQTSARDLPQTKTLIGALRVFFTFPTPLILLTKILIVGTIRLWLPAPTLGDLIAVAFVFVYWPLQEWFLHAYVLHLRPREIFGWRLDPYFAQRHRAHHLKPWILETTFLPVRVLVPLIPVNIAVWYLLTPSVSIAATGVIAMSSAALFYEWCHYVAHIPYVPRSSWLREVVRNHHLHHFKNEQYWHGFTVPWVDQVFGTAPDPQDVPRSPTVRTLGVDPPDTEAG